MAQTNDGAVIAERIISLLETNRVALGLKAIHYGDLSIIGTVPAVCVEPARTLTEYNETGLKVLNSFDVGVIVYHTGRGGVEGSQRDADIVTREIRDVLNSDARPALQGGTTFAGLLMDGLVSQIEYGYRILLDESMRANRIIFTGRSKTELVLT